MTRHTCAHTHTQLPQKDNFHHESTLLIHMAQSDIFNSILSYSVLFYFIKKKKRFIKSVLWLTNRSWQTPVQFGNLEV